MKEGQHLVSRNLDATSTAERHTSNDLNEVMDAEAQLLEENEVRDNMLKNNPSNLSEDYYQDAGQAYLDNMKHTPLAKSLRKGNSTHRMSGNLSMTNDKNMHPSNRKHSPLEVPLSSQLLGGLGK